MQVTPDRAIRLSCQFEMILGFIFEWQSTQILLSTTGCPSPAGTSKTQTPRSTQMNEKILVSLICTSIMRIEANQVFFRIMDNWKIAKFFVFALHDFAEYSTICPQKKVQ